MSSFSLCNRVKDNEGAALVIALIILVLLTVIGVYAVFTSSVETRIAGYERLQEESFYAADGGTDYGRTVIELFLTTANPTLPSGASAKPDQDAFRNELLGTDTSGSPYVDTTIGDCNMAIEVERIKVIQPEGGSAAFGDPAAEKEMTVYYKIKSSASSQSAGSANSEVETTYGRKVH